MNSELKKKFLDEAIRIGEDLIDKSISSPQGTCWRTMSITGNEVSWIEKESIYSGTSGIILFFLDLFKETQETKYLDIARSSMLWVEEFCDKNPTDYYALFTGRLGVAFVMIQMARLCNDEGYEQKALEIALEASKFLDQPKKVDDLINGISGTILGLVHVHSVTQDPRLITLIEQFTSQLIDRAHLGKTGLYWDKSYRNIQGLCGFSHGAGGIGYVFLELGHYFENPAFYWMAEQAFAYENAHFDHTCLNWPDFRNGFHDEKSFQDHKEKYLKGDKDFFHTAGDMHAWCHGSPGIGLSRLRACELLGKEVYKTDTDHAIEAGRQLLIHPTELMGSSVLCHGSAGNAMLFIEAYRSFSDKKFHAEAIEIGQKMLASFKKRKRYMSGYSYAKGEEDTSLFMGNAGVGHFYLSLVNPNDTLSLLKPDTPEPSHQGLNTSLQNLSVTNIKLTLAKRYFPRTMKVLTTTRFDHKSDSLKDSLRQELFDGVNQDVKLEGEDRVAELHRFESSEWQLADRVQSDSYLHIKRLIDSESSTTWLAQTPDEQLLDTTLIMDEWSTVHSASYDCLNPELTEKGDYCYLLSLHSGGVQSFELSEFAYDILTGFNQPNTVQGCIEHMNMLYEISAPEDLKQVHHNIILQVREAIKSGVLCVTNET